ncbi:MAG: glycosyltransferase family 2 protein [Luteibacter sp.]|uniref:glycosyltransferase family 2 protein n=1 Tax=unclassified Luteibacter TaxID=2620188 RepID=UPI00069182CA|nr:MULTISPECIES: glycosyltransferase family 2 protein [unclassified Luteibacter]MDQ7994930.1 glycosyltransferase family 2 protein [Luteibacter sp.]MDQ8047556.1 glycosyltransferase family 2 protein [Luteibacter sp.]MDR6641214.1 glycosyltransferase involved in cell wall biosynthesis [Luteibacter sp. 1214]
MSTTTDAMQTRSDDAMALVSVYIPTRNRSALLRRAVDSVLAQSYPEIEILICDEASTDDTAEVVADYIQRYPGKFTYLRNETPQGACRARNRCMEQASGTYVTGLDDDDLFHPQRIECLVDLYRRNKVSFVCSRFRYFQSDAQIAALRDRQYGKAELEKVEPITLSALLYANLAGNQVLTELSRMRELGGFDEAMPSWQDYDMWIRLAERFGPALRTRQLLSFVDDDRSRARIRNSTKRAEGSERFIAKHTRLMSADQRRNHRNIQYVMNKQRPPLGDIARNISVGGYKSTLKVLLHKFFGVAIG